MKKIMVLVALLANFLMRAIEIPKTAFHIDSIQAVVFGEKPQIITYSDMTKLSLSGQQRSLEDLIFESRVIDDAVRYKIMGDEDAVDKYLAMLQKQNNMTLDDMKHVFASAGMTYQEGREELRRMQAVQQMVDFKVRAQVIVPRKAVEEYYEKNPQIKEARITVQRGFLAYDADLDAQKRALAFMERTGKEMKGIQWSEPFDLTESEVAEERAFLFALKEGALSKASDVGIGFELFRVLKSSPREMASLDSRYKEIADELRRPIFEQLLENYRKRLMESASVLYLKPINPFAV